jgi:carboxyl-terminal processing protease
VAVLIDGTTASAAEIVAGALQHDGAVVVGTRSFGKGTVQAVRPLPGGGALKLTVASFTLAGDRVVDGRGIRPAVVAPDSPATVRDETLLAALAALHAA